MVVGSTASAVSAVPSSVVPSWAVSPGSAPSPVVAVVVPAARAGPPSDCRSAVKSAPAVASAVVAVPWPAVAVAVPVAGAAVVVLVV